jgi:hypothetical protein
MRNEGGGIRRIVQSGMDGVHPFFVFCLLSFVFLISSALRR